jgi:MFS family permease
MQPLHLTYALMLFCYSSNTSTRVLLSLYALELGAEAYAIGLLIATLYIVPVALSWPVGIFSDRVGSRGLLLAGTLCAVVGLVVPYFMRSMPALYMAAVLIGVSFCLYNVLLQNLVGLLSAPEDRARNFSNSSLMGATATFVGPLFAGVAVDYSGSSLACLYVAGLSAFAAVLLIGWGKLLPGGNPQPPPASASRSTLLDKELLRALLTSGLVQVGQDLYQFYIPIYGHASGLSGSAIGGVLASFALAAFVARFGMPRLVAQLGAEKVLGYSFYLAGLGFFLVPIFENVILLSLVSFIFGLGMGCGQPITTLLIFGRSVQGRSGATLGLRQSVNYVMRVSAPVVFGSVASVFGLLPVFWINACMMAAGGWLTRPDAKRDEDGA